MSWISKPWDYKIDLRGVWALPWPEFRDEIVRVFEESDWLRDAISFDLNDGDTTLLDLIEELAETEDREEFDNVMAYIYDEADFKKTAWIST